MANLSGISRFFLLALLSLLVLHAPVVAQDPPPVVPAAPLQKGVIKIRSLSLGKTFTFSVELAIKPDEQALGLMNRTSIPEGTGMLFVFDPPRATAFWMKNTLVPLDMIFINEDGIIIKIAANTKPHDLTLVPSGGIVASVLEIAGGQAAELGLKVGDKLLKK